MTDNEVPSCQLTECGAPCPPGRTKFCSETHARRQRQRAKPPVEIEQKLKETDELRAALRRSQATAARAKAKSEDLIEAVYKASYDAQLALGKVSPVTPPNIKLLGRSDSAQEEVALLHTTDWQYGKRTDGYNRAMADKRIALLGSKVALLTTIQRTAHPVNKIVVAMGGDMVEGLNIFPGQAWEVDGTLFEMIFGAVKAGTELLRSLLSQFTIVEVVAEEGNHGRLMKRGDFPRTDNTDIMVYELMKRAFENEPRLHWVPRLSWHQMIHIGAYHAMLIHGDEIKSFGGNTPAFGLLRKGTAWSSGVTPQPFQDIYFGHYHTAMSLTLPNGGTMFGTGSTESDSAYAAEFVAAKGLPSQRLHYIDPRRGRVTCEYKVYLSDKEKQRHEQEHPATTGTPG